MSHYFEPAAPPKLQAAAVLSQASPVQNTWYTVLNTTLNVRIYSMGVLIATTGETLEVRLTIDGNTIVQTAGVAATNDTEYDVRLLKYAASGAINVTINTTDVSYYKPFLIEGRSVKVEVRKTTAAGTGTLKAVCIYGLY